MIIFYINNKRRYDGNETTLHLSHNVWKVNNYKSKYGLKHRALGHTEQQAIKGHKMLFNNTNKKINGI